MRRKWTHACCSRERLLWENLSRFELPERRCTICAVRRRRSVPLCQVLKRAQSGTLRLRRTAPRLKRSLALRALTHVPGVGDGAGVVSAGFGEGAAPGELSGFGEGDGLAFAVVRFVLA